jgi:hypothetical protein
VIFFSLCTLVSGILIYLSLESIIARRKKLPLVVIIKNPVPALLIFEYADNLIIEQPSAQNGLPCRNISPNWPQLQQKNSSPPGLCNFDQ